MKRKSFPYESYEQRLSAALSMQIKQNPQKFSLHLNEIKTGMKFPFCHLRYFRISKAYLNLLIPPHKTFNKCNWLCENPPCLRILHIFTKTVVKS